ncbi:serine hydrolase FSH [Ophiocordyceps camponoti-floridani]|uniref:Serine hydrolase FSH n=1 Tax=Ophiocordyceps camponoti-floridani TaxID=2030778 RepID=A0A8H4VFL9_9HYPO|nr:serine hydrolase FSH [Ophiocordyceps camponoti-floridani]
MPPSTIKVLMLHGFSQSGPIFRAKTRALEKLLLKALAPSLSPVLLYPTAPIRLLARDVPGFVDNGDDDSQRSDARAWFRRDDATGVYVSLAEGMKTIAEAIREAGGVDAVCGFSQGALVASLVTAALEPARLVPEGSDSAAWVRNLREANRDRPLRFAVFYSGFVARADGLDWCYDPKLVTPTLHYMGSLDTVVSESRNRQLADKCRDSVVVVHPGAHYVPVTREWAMPLAGFIREHISRSQCMAGL